MNTEQKAREWLTEKYFYGEESRKIDKGAEIITALLAEHQALLKCVKFARDNATIPTIKQRLSKAISMCEESKCGTT